MLGAEPVRVGSGWCYRFGETQLNCHGPDAHFTPVAKVPIIPGGSDLCFVWPESIHTALAHLEKHGVQVEVGPAPGFGARGDGISVYFRDPDGSVMEFISYENDEQSGQ